MAKIDEIRKQYPQYDDMSGQALVTALYNKNKDAYGDMELAEFYQRMTGMEMEQPNVVQRAARGVEEGFRRVLDGFQQLGAQGDVSRARGADSGGALGVSNLEQQIRQMRAPARQTDEIIDAQQRQAEFEQGVQRRRQEFELSPSGQSVAGKVGAFVGEAAPAVAIPATRAASVPGAIAQNAAIGGAIGAAQFAGSDAERGANTAVGAILGGVIPEGFRLGGKAVTATRELLGAKTAGAIMRMGGTELAENTLKRIAAAERLGMRLTPAEATGDAVLAARQGRTGGSEEGFRIMKEAADQRRTNERAVLVEFFDSISPDGSSANTAIRNAAQKIVREEEQALSKAAAPFYKAAYEQAVPEQQLAGLMQDPVIGQAYESVLRTPVYQRALGDSPVNSLKTLDLVKRRLDDQIETAINQGSRNEARLLREAKNQLVQVADEVSPDYAQARAIFSEGAPGVTQLREGVVGRLANLDENQIKNVSKILFDPGQTDLNVIRNLGQRFSKENPEAWRRIIRNEMERRLDAVKADRGATTFYNTILRKDRDFQQFLAATKSMPEVRQSLIDMRRAFADLLNPITAKTAAAQARSSLDVPRSTGEFLVNVIQNAMGGNYDRAAAEIITNPQWHEALKEALKQQGINRPAAFGELLSRVAATQIDSVNPVSGAVEESERQDAQAAPNERQATE